MLDALYQDSTSRVLDDMQARPTPRPAPEPGFWAGVWSAAPRGFGVAVNETVRTGFRAITANADAVMLRQQREADDFTAEAIFKRRLELADERAQTDAQLRAAVDYWQPDPGTVGAAAEAVQGFTRFATKAVGYSLAVGPVAGAALTGADIGGAEYLNLRDQGVDAATAAKVGAVRGLAAGVTVALPVAGKGLASTAALVGLGGPGAFVAEQSAARKILADADYSKLAEQIDPFDPVGLSVATAGAALFGFGAYALRGAGRNQPADPVADRQSVPPQEAVDAAQIVVAKDVAEEQALARPGDLVADAVERRAQERAVSQLAAGERVEVSDTVPLREGDTMPAPLAEMIARVDELVDNSMMAAEDARPAPQGPSESGGNDGGLIDPAFRADEVLAAIARASAVERRAFSEQLTEAGAEWFGESEVKADGAPLLVYHGTDADFARFELADGSRSESGTSFLGFWFTVDKLVAGRYAQLAMMSGGGDPKVIPVFLKIENPMRVDEAELREVIESNTQWMGDRYYADELRRKAEENGHDGIIFEGAGERGDSGLFGQDTFVVFSPDQIRLAEDVLTQSEPSAPNPAGATAAKVDEMAAANGETEPAPVETAPAADAAAQARPGDDLPEVAAARAVPDVEVELPDGTRMTAAEALRRVQDEAAADVNDAQLLQVAAACAIGA